MPKTNFDDFIEKLTPDEVADYINQKDYEECCKKCCVYYKEKCKASMCLDGIKQWLLSEKES